MYKQTKIIIKRVILLSVFVLLYYGFSTILELQDEKKPEIQQKVSEYQSILEDDIVDEKEAKFVVKQFDNNRRGNVLANITNEERIYWYIEEMSNAEKITPLQKESYLSSVKRYEHDEMKNLKWIKFATFFSYIALNIVIIIFIFLRREIRKSEEMERQHNDLPVEQ